MSGSLTLPLIKGGPNKWPTAVHLVERTRDLAMYVAGFFVNLTQPPPNAEKIVATACGNYEANKSFGAIMVLSRMKVNDRMLMTAMFWG